MDDTVGQIQYDARIETKNLRKDADEADNIARKAGDDIGYNTERGTSRASAALEKFASIAKTTSIVVGTTLATGVAAAAKASWDQVAAVQQATVGLNAYEKNGDKVNAVLKNLIAYARSDLGVLFNRKDLFDSAQSLKIMGDKTEDLVGHVQILSRSVGLGLSNWDDLNLIVGRVGSTGRLTGEDFDNLTKAGFKLDTNLRNTNITFAELFKQLDKGIPVDALNGQANTIKGLSIRIQTAFRGIGDAVLGVDSETSKFIEGGIGDRFTKAIGNATTFLKSMKKPMVDVTKQTLDFADSTARVAQDIFKSLTPALGDLGRSISKDLVPSIQKVLNSEFVRFLGTSLVVAADASIRVISSLTKVLSGFISQGSQSTSILIGLTAGMLAYSVITKAVTIATNAQATAQLFLNTAMKANPFVFLAAGAAGIIAAYAHMVTTTDGNTDASKRLKLARDQLKIATDAQKTAEDNLRGAMISQEAANLRVERAMLDYNIALASSGRDSLEAREAALALKIAQDDLASANANVRDRTNENSQAQHNFAKASNEIVTANYEVAKSANDSARAYENFHKQLDNVTQSINNRSPKANDAINKMFSVPGRASGGSVSAGSPYIVGENSDGSLNKTSELFVPRTAGSIVNSKDLRSAIGSSSNSTTYEIGSIHIGSEVDGERWLRKLTKNSEIIGKGITPQQRYA